MRGNERSSSGNVSSRHSSSSGSNISIARRVIACENGSANNAGHHEQEH
jgi:hypothetical protein